MSRSIKKGPFCAPELLKRVNDMNKNSFICGKSAELFISSKASVVKVINEVWKGILE